MSTMISPTCHHGITGHHGGDVCKNPTKPHRCHPLSTGACQPCLAPQGCTCHRFQIVFEVEVLGMILYESMKLSYKNYNRIISVQMIQTEYSWIFMMYSNDIINIYIYPFTCSIPPIFPSSKQKSPDFFSTCQRQRAPRGALPIPIPMAACRVIPRRSHSPMGFHGQWWSKRFLMISFIKHRLDSHIRKKKAWTFFEHISPVSGPVIHFLKLPKIYIFCQWLLWGHCIFFWGSFSGSTWMNPQDIFPIAGDLTKDISEIGSLLTTENWWYLGLKT